MLERNSKEIELLRYEKEKLKLENKKLKEWVDILTVRNQQLDVRIQVLKSSIRNFGIAIGEDSQ